MNIIRRLLTRLGTSFRPSTGEILDRATHLLLCQGYGSAKFRQGIELLNDAHTPMEFVVATLIKNVGLSKIDAIRAMLDTHKKGGVLLPLATESAASQAAAAIQRDAESKNYPLVCRAVSVTQPTGIAATESCRSHVA